MKGEMSGSRTAIDFCIYLTADYSRISLTLMLEALREANVLIGFEKYRYQLVTDKSQIVEADARVALLDKGFNDRCTVVVLVGGDNVGPSVTDELSHLLKRHQRQGGTILAVGGGVGILARLGMLKGKVVSCYVDHIRYLCDLYPDVSLNCNLFSVSEGVYSCAGGLASLDMLFDLIEAFTPSIYEELCVRLAVDKPRSGTVRQKNIMQRRYSGLGDCLIDAIELMEANIDEVLSVGEIASHCSISKRQLERLFKKHLSQTPSQFYLQLRLKRARNRILNTTNPVLDIAYSCGFVAPTHFSRCYKAFFGITPKKDRQGMGSAMGVIG